MGKFENVSFNVRRGEIVGMAGLVGAGRSETATAIFGLDRAATGNVYIKGQKMEMHNVNVAMANRIGFLPEDRKRAGLVLMMSVADNVSLAHIDFFSDMGWINRKREVTEIEKLTKRLRVKAPTIDTITAGLSGGNQQKVALAKWLARTCDLLIVDEPTRGVDVGAKSEIYQILDEAACQGLAILMISSELPEVMNLSRRIVVLREGFIAGELSHEKFSEEALIHLMA